MIILFPIGLVVSVYIGFSIYTYIFPAPDNNPTGKYVLITGCDTGFGYSLAVELDRRGFNVLAGVYRQSTLAKQLSERACVFQLDITQQQDIDAAYQLVKSHTSSLYALVNNAGIADGGLIDWISVESMRQIMEVNFFGHVTMTKTFLPLLLVQKHSRVINVSSAAGFLASAGASAYSSSKYALEAFSDCLRREMAVWNLYVSIIEPGFMRTPIVEGMADKMRTVWYNRTDEETKERWGEQFFRDWLDNGTKMANQTADDPKKVIKALCHAVMNTKPRSRYRPGWQSSLFCFPLSIAPTWIVDGLIRLGERGMAPPIGIFKQKEE